MRPQELVALGRVLKPRGLKGEVKVASFAQSDEPFLKAGRVQCDVDGRLFELTIHEVSGAGDILFLKFEGIDSIEKAETLRNGILRAGMDCLPALKEGEFFYYDLAGMSVVTEEGREIGTVREVVSYPTILSNGKELSLPMIHDAVKQIDAGARRIVVAAKALEEAL